MVLGVGIFLLGLGRWGLLGLFGRCGLCGSCLVVGRRCMLGFGRLVV